MIEWSCGLLVPVKSTVTVKYAIWFLTMGQPSESLEEALAFHFPYDSSLPLSILYLLESIGNILSLLRTWNNIQYYLWWVPCSKFWQKGCKVLSLRAPDVLLFYAQIQREVSHISDWHIVPEVHQYSGLVFLLMKYSLW